MSSSTSAGLPRPARTASAALRRTARAWATSWLALAAQPWRLGASAGAGGLGGRRVAGTERAPPAGFGRLVGGRAGRGALGGRAALAAEVGLGALASGRGAAPRSKGSFPRTRLGISQL